MAFEPGSSKLSLWTDGAVSSASQWVRSAFGRSNFTPEETLAEAKNIDPRLVPKVPMQSADIDTNLLLELSKIGMKHGKLVSEQSHPELMQSWKAMSARAGLKKAPQLIIVESKTINAMTVSPEEVVMTTGLLKKLDLREVNAVLGHELGHAVSDHKRPRLLATGIFGLGGAYSTYKLWKAYGTKWASHSPLMTAVGEIVSLSIGGMLGGVVANQVSVKPTELQADLKGAAISGDPMGLVSALRKLESGRKRDPFISALSYLHSGYPTAEQRIKNLERVAVVMPPHAKVPAIAVQPVITPLPNQPGPQVSDVMADARVETPAQQAVLS